jgi:hypothetical protein
VKERSRHAIWALALLAGLAGCTAASAPPSQDALAARLPVALDGFERLATLPADHGPTERIIRYRDKATGALATVWLLTPPGPGLPDGGASPQVVQALTLERLATLLAAGNLPPGSSTERGPDYAVLRPGETAPHMLCTDMRMRIGSVLLRDFVCARGLAGLLVKIRVVVTHEPQEMDAARRLMIGFSALVLDALAPEGPDAAPPPVEEPPPGIGPLLRT